MSNRVTLAQMVEMPAKAVAELPIEQIALLLEDAAELKSAAKRADDHLFAAMSHRFSQRAADLRQAKGVDTGTVRFTEDDFTIVADLPKKVTWNNDGLADVASKLAEMGEPVGDYIATKRDVSERSFEAWPNSLKKLFNPHRTLGVGKAGFRLERKKEST